MTNDTDRRRFLQFVGGAAAATLAGCGGQEATPTAAQGDDQVPQQYRTATSLGGTERNPDALSSKDAVNYQEQPSEGQQCSGCQFYIEDKNGDGAGACAIVEGTIQPDAWCASYSPFQTETE